MRPFEIYIVTLYTANINLYEKLIKELSRLFEWKILRLNKMHISTIYSMQENEDDIRTWEGIRAAPGNWRIF